MKRIFIFLILFVYPSLVFAQDYYVRSSGTNGDGLTYATAWVGLNNINWSSVDSGNGILYVDGVFTSGLTISVSGESGTPIHVKGYTTAASVRGVNISSNSYITIEGMRIEGDTSEYGIRVSGASSDHITIKDCVITNNYMGGIYITGSGYPGPATDANCPSDWLIEGNEIYENGRGTPNRKTAGVLIYAYNGIVRNNNIHNNGNWWPYDHALYLIATYEGASGPSDVLYQIYGNRLHDNEFGRGGKVQGNAHIYNNIVYGNEMEGIDTSHNITQPITYHIWNNLIYNNGYSGIRLQDTVPVTAYIYNNTLYHNGTRQEYGRDYQSEISIERNEPSVVVRNNIMYALSGNYTIGGVSQSNLTCTNNVMYVGTSSYSCTSTVASNPQFVSVPSNLQLQSSSPAINAGATLVAPYNVDFLGYTRPDGAYDIGAYEFNNLGSPPPPTDLVPSPPALIGIQ